MSIAQNEAETIYQPESMCSGFYDRESRIKAYVRGSTSEPSWEQIRAVAEYLASTVTEPPVLDDYKAFVPMAKKILEVARNAVM